MAVATSKAQQLLGKEVVNTNKAIQAHIKELQSTADNLDRASDEYKDLQREIERYSSELKSASSVQDKAADSLQDLTNETKELPGNLDKISGGLESMKGFLDEIIIGVGIAAFTTLTDSARELAGQIKDIARSTGIGVDSLSRLAAFAKSSGVEFETFKDILFPLSEKLGELAKGEGEDLVQALASIGIKATDSSGKLRDTMDILLDVSRAFDVYADGPQKTALAIQLFDDAGADLIGVLSQLHKGFGDLSGALSADFIDKLDESEDSSNLLQLQLSQLGASIGEKLVPILTMLTTGLSTVLDAFLKLPKPVQDAVIYAASLALGLGALSLAFTAVSAVGPLVVTAVKGMIGVFSGVLSSILLLGNPVALFTNGLKLLTTAAGVLVNGLKAFVIGLGALINPINLVIAGIVAISTILYASNKDFRNWFNNVAGILGDRLYTFLVGASIMFGRFAKEVGNALGRVGQGLADFFSTKVLPVLGGVVSGLVKMFDAFFRWIFHGFDAVAKKVIELYEALPEGIRALLGQVNRFIVDVFENLPVFRRTQQLINSISGFISEAMRIGGDARRLWAAQRDTDLGWSIPKPTPLKQITIPEQEATSSSTAKPATTTKPSPQTDAAKKAQEATKIRDQILQLQTTILNKTKESYQTIQAEIIQLQDTIKQTVAPFNAFNTSTQKFLKMVGEADFPFPTKAQEITDKYKAVLENFQTASDLITQETAKRQLELDPQKLPEWKKLSEVLSKIPTEKLPSKPLPAKPKDQVEQNFNSMFQISGNVSNALAEVDNLKKALELVKGIMPEVQKDIEDMLKPQQEQLRTATANLAVIQKTNNFLAQGVAPEQARINALAQIEKEQRQQSLDALKAMVNPLEEALRLANLTGNQNAINTLTETINTLQTYISQWDTVNNKIDQHNKKIANAEKQNKQLTERRERNLQIAESIASSIGDGLTDVFDLLLSKTDDWGAALKDIASNVLRQIANQLFQIMVITPIVKAMTAGLGNMFGVSFADGGIMTSRGPVELKKYARGGIANSPQLALFGEGRMPEAYVPLPDGRRIPVAMEGGGSGGGNFTVNVNVDASGSQVSGSPSQGEQLGRAIAQAVQSEIVKQQRPGGLLYT
jgi:septal ring factor EnvC (AmiA/AmiB activator)